ncbi:hypothetical protein DERP_011005 [Dermatophagoides pteronyssinus]|uniref:Uncharacterized protein n=1 Tax=Dermatophagoides pteronyssinus TaxID=6956 RepID=A0ABQ8JV04_DERPT|nr:hypothetical protein DERP_011005 [Dermatophagoides pteronyssinus]
MPEDKGIFFFSCLKKLMRKKEENKDPHCFHHSKHSYPLCNTVARVPPPPPVPSFNDNHDDDKFYALGTFILYMVKKLFKVNN